jgi:hypothetical protein
MMSQREEDAKAIQVLELQLELARQQQAMDALRDEAAHALKLVTQHQLDKAIAELNRIVEGE